LRKAKNGAGSAGAGLLFLISILFWFAQYTYVPYVNPTLSALGASAVFMGWVGGAYGVTQLILRVPLGLWADRIGKKRCVVSGCLLCAASSFCMLSVNHPAAFLAGRGLAGAASSSWVAFTILYSSYFPEKQSGPSITMINISSQIGQIAAFIAGGAAVSLFGIKSSFIMAGIVGAIAFILTFSISGRSGSKPPVSLGDFAKVIRDPNLLLCSIYSIAAQIIAFSTFQTFVNNYAGSVGIETGRLSYMYLFVLGPCIIVGYIIGKCLFKLIDMRILITAGFLLLAAYSFILPFTVNARQIFLISVLAGIGYSFTYNVLLGLCVRDIPQDKMSAAMGFFQAVYGIGMTLGPIAMGWLVEYYGLKTGFVIIAALSLVTAVSVPVVRRLAKWQ